MYNNIVLDHFSNPRNMGTIENADGIGHTGNPADGDKITIYIKVWDDILINVMFKTFGCGAAIAASSMLTELVIGKTIKAALQVTNDDVAYALGGLPSQKLKCSNIAADALYAAIEDYCVKKNKEKIISKTDVKEGIEKRENSKGVQDENQIQRYLRHIIMPEISGLGQRKLLETKVVLFAPSINESDVLLNYLAATGIGHLIICLKNRLGFAITIEHVKDLNPDVRIELIEDTDLCKVYKNPIDFNIIIGDLNYINDIKKILAQHQVITTITAVVSAWNGYINIIDNVQQLIDVYEEDSDRIITENDTCNLKHFIEYGLKLSYAYMETLIVIELVKAKLHIGSILQEGFYYNLLDFIFINNLSINEGLKKMTYLSNYKREDMLVRNQETLACAKVLIIGAGGLGSPVAYILAKLGIGTIGIIDYDHIEISNLNRQILHTTTKIGMSKVESARKVLKAINPKVNVEIYPTAFTRDNAMELLKDYDIVVDGLDNIPTRYLLNDACYFAKKPLIEAGVLTYYGQVTVIDTEETPCYRCIFSDVFENTQTRGCAERGVLGPVAGLIGMLQGVEVIKILLGIDSSLKGKLLLYDANETEFTMIELHKKKSCKLCGNKRAIFELEEYDLICQK
ncbi:MAG: hypothetical protein CVV02_07865 [Firmicutes bacterium HGW-Firmicutes-7]|nr:MAG: hypothetical protein CVV02_07865 [Firmicutes bacterium HGW-Firmicutes-7]